MEGENGAGSSSRTGERSDRWPDRPGWEILAQTIETLAKACGGKAQCHKKYEYLSVNLEMQDVPRDQRIALYNLSEVIELVSETEDHGDQSSVHWVRSAIAQKEP